MRLNRLILLPLLLAGCSKHDTEAADQRSKIEDLENRVADLESRADESEHNQKTIAAAAALGLDEVTPPVDETDTALQEIRNSETEARLRKIERAQIDQEAKAANDAFEDSFGRR